MHVFYVYDICIKALIGSTGNIKWYVKFEIWIQHNKERLDLQNNKKFWLHMNHEGRWMRTVDNWPFSENIYVYIWGEMSNLLTFKQLV